MADELENVLQQIRANESSFRLSEEATKQGAILPILSRLGWDRENIGEVVPEYAAGAGRVDYCLHLNGTPTVFIEAKRTTEDLENHQEQLLEYAFRHGVKIAVLTNGLVWWFYLPLSQGSWEQRRFFTVDVQKQEIADAASHFRQFMERGDVASGDAVARAEQVHASREKSRVTRETLPKAWHQLCTEPDELLGELLAERVESLCGHRPDQDTVAEFLLGQTQAGSGEPAGEPAQGRSGQSRGATPRSGSAANTGGSSTPPPTRGPSRSRSADGLYTGKRPVAMTFAGEHRHVSTFKDVITELCAIIHEKHPSEFDRLFQIRGRRREYFARDGRNMNAPREIGQTGSTSKRTSARTPSWENAMTSCVYSTTAKTHCLWNTRPDAESPDTF